MVDQQGIHLFYRIGSMNDLEIMSVVKNVTSSQTSIATRINDFFSSVSISFFPFFIMFVQITLVFLILIRPNIAIIASSSFLVHVFSQSFVLLKEHLSVMITFFMFYDVTL